ncbi:MAG: hypothetical protein PVF58_01970 [Candidatus Methanofastidiosia archaeon]|jgi:hypothetical protein
MDLIKIGKASDLLMESEKAKEALIDVFGEETMPDSRKHQLSLIQELVRFCEREETEITLVEGIISSLLRNRKPAAEDIMRVLDMLSECQRDLKNYIIEKAHLSAPKSKELNEYYSAISEYVRMKEENTREQRKELVREQIFRTPGLYVTRLFEILQVKFGKEGFSLTSVQQYVNQLSFEKKVITIGGPQGRMRYCFPNPSMITDRPRFYHHVLAYEGIVQEKITNKFIPTRPRKYRDIFLVNGVEIPILLVTDFGKLPNIEKNLIRSYGDFEPFEYLVETEGFTPKDQNFSCDVLRARKVTRVVGEQEEEVWLDKQRATLSS